MWLFLLLFLLLAACGPSRTLTEQDLQRKAVENYVAGKTFLEQGDLNRALDRFRTAQSQDPSLEINRIAIGLTLLNLTRFAEAETIFTDLMGGNSNRYPVLLGLARAQFGLSRYSLALSSAREALELKQVSADAHILIIKSLSQVEAHEEALEALGRFEKSNPNDARLPPLKANVVSRRDAWAARVSTPLGKIKRSDGISRQDLAFLFGDFFPKFMMEGTGQQQPAAKDIPTDEPYATACRSSIRRGLIEVLPDETFRPGFVLTRGDFAIYLARFITIYLGDSDMEHQYVGQEGLLFADLPNHHWAFSSVKLMSELGIMKGNSDGTFGLNDPMTGEATLVGFAMLKAYLEKTADSNGGKPIKQD